MEQFLTSSTSFPFGVPDRFETTDLMNLKAALVIAHPGHELCVHGWLSLAKPVVFVLTDGSGRSGEPRLDSTQRTLSETGARSGAWFGKHTDHVVYQALLHHDLDFFRELAVQLADALEMAEVDYVVGDSLEGYNPTHDVCRMLINAAITLVNQRTTRRPVRNFDFPLIGPNLRRGAITLDLNETAFEQKASAMRACPELADEVSVGLDGAVLKKLDGLGELAKEIKLLIESRGGADFFRHESFRVVSAGPNGGESVYALEQSDSIVSSSSSKPFYERYAEMLVLAGHYQQVIRYVDHVAPVADALRDVTRNQPARAFAQSNANA